MKHLLTLTALLISSLAMGQMPYNPDSNGDYLIGASDLVSFLGLYNTYLVDSTLTCSYEGTELESWVGGIFDGSLILDSVYVEYLYQDSVETYLPGCPNPVFIETVIERSYRIPIEFGYDAERVFWSGGITLLGYFRSAFIEFRESNGAYSFRVSDYEIAELTNYGQNSYVVSTDFLLGGQPLPFPENWTLNEDGIQVDWQSNSWVANCQSFRMIPFWHEAE